jgi:cellulose synthase/poly-beta-1,6-N-acetylglucosamine synthase-like glycosyltransferase
VVETYGSRGMSAGTIFAVILAIISFGYGLAIMGFVRGLRKLKRQAVLEPDIWPSVSIVMPARNEAEVLERTLKSLFQQDYPGPWEIIVVDDRSHDSTPQILSALAAANSHLRYLTVADPHPRSPKKNALAMGIRNSTSELVMTTDADCIYDPGWLRAMIAPMSDGVGVVAGMTEFDLPDVPVPLWQKLQWLDFVAQQFLAAGAIGAGVPSSCNGSNLAYRRAVYDEIAGFGQSKAVVSGDDVLFAQRVSKLTRWRVVFATHPASIVRSLPVQTLREMFHQRIRWASKGLSYRRSMLTFLFGMYAYYLMWIAAPFVAVFAPSTMGLIAGAAIWKTTWDYATVRMGCRMFRLDHLLPYFLPFIVCHIAFSPIFGIAGLIVPYRWKDGWYRTATMPRTIRKGLRRWRRFRLRRHAPETSA